MSVRLQVLATVGKARSFSGSQWTLDPHVAAGLYPGNPWNMLREFESMVSDKEKGSTQKRIVIS